MSLLFVGYDFESVNWGKISGNHDDFKKHDNGIFAIADSAITTFQGGKTLLTGFRKIYDLEAKIWKPYFMPDGTFRDYLDIYSEHPMIVGFAGNTLVAQHILSDLLFFYYFNYNMYYNISYDIILAIIYIIIQIIII